MPTPLVTADAEDGAAAAAGDDAARPDAPAADGGGRTPAPPSAPRPGTTTGATAASATPDADDADPDGAVDADPADARAAPACAAAVDEACLRHRLRRCGRGEVRGVGSARARRWNEDAWNEHYRRLEAFHARHGHCAVPAKYEDDPALGRWARRERMALRRRRDVLTPARIAKLARLGFGATPLDVKWNEMFAKLEAFKAANGHSNVSENNPDRELGQWVKTQRKYIKQGRLFLDRSARLRELGFEVLTEHGGRKWEKRQDQGEGGDTGPRRASKAPASYVAYGLWVAEQRRRAAGEEGAAPDAARGATAATKGEGTAPRQVERRATSAATTAATTAAPERGDAEKPTATREGKRRRLGKPAVLLGEAHLPDAERDELHIEIYRYLAQLQDRIERKPEGREDGEDGLPPVNLRELRGAIAQVSDAHEEGATTSGRPR